MFYLYSSIHGNEFICKEEFLGKLDIEQKYEARDSIKAIHKESTASA